MDIKQARKNVIEQQVRPWGGLNVRANQALTDTPRENFVPEEYQKLVFADIEIPLNKVGKMLSPKIEGRILDSLDLKGHENVLEVGTGSGYFTSVLSLLSNSVISIDADKDLHALAKSKINKLNLKEYANLISIINNEYDYLKDEIPFNLPSGIIHADLFPDNVFFIEDQLSGIIDFYFACNDYYAYELAICINAWCFERNNEFNVSKAKSFLHQYNSIRKISADELKALPILARAAALRFLLTRLYDKIHHNKNDLVSTKDPKEYYEKLKFHQTVKNVSEYGL